MALRDMTDTSVTGFSNRLHYFKIVIDHEAQCYQSDITKPPYV